MEWKGKKRLGVRGILRGQKLKKFVPREALIYSTENKSVLLYCMPFRSNSCYLKSCEKMAMGNTD